MSGKGAEASGREGNNVYRRPAGPRHAARRRWGRGLECMCVCGGGGLQLNTSVYISYTESRAVKGGALK